jgi:hypothetical protein
MTACEVRKKARPDIDVVDGVAAIVWKLDTASLAKFCVRGPLWWQLLPPSHDEPAPFRVICLAPRRMRVQRQRSNPEAGETATSACHGEAEREPLQGVHG